MNTEAETAAEADRSAPLADDRAELFCHRIANGENQTEAYRKAFPKSLEWRDKTVWSRASELAATEEVKGRVAHIKEMAAKSAIYTLADHLRRLDALSISAEKAADFTAAVRAEEARGKASGFYVQRLEHTGKGGGPIETKQTRDLTDAELKAELERHGIKP